MRLIETENKGMGGEGWGREEERVTIGGGGRLPVFG